MSTLKPTERLILLALEIAGELDPVSMEHILVITGIPTKYVALNALRVLVARKLVVEWSGTPVCYSLDDQYRETTFSHQVVNPMRTGNADVSYETQEVVNE